MKILSFLLFFFVTIEAFACSRAELRVNKFFENRKLAFNQARQDAGINRTKQPYKVDSVPLTDKNKNPIKDESGNIIMTREYYYVNDQGKHIVIQEHTAGHLGTREAGASPHFNVRPADDKRNGKVPGTLAHYNIGTE